MAKASACFTVGGISGKHDMEEIKRELDTLPSVLSVTVSNDSRVSVGFDATGVQPARIEKRLAEMGYQVLNSRIGSRGLGYIETDRGCFFSGAYLRPQYARWGCGQELPPRDAERES